MNIDKLVKCIPHMKEILAVVEKAFENYDDPAHDISHVLRVTESASEIAIHEGADLETAVLAALLHDIKRPEEDVTGMDHAECGARYASQLLDEMGFGSQLTREVSEAIKAHRYSSETKPFSISARILQDADRLDAIGAIAVARVFSYSGKTGTPLHSSKLKRSDSYNGYSSTAINHFYEKILKITPESFWTKTAKGIAENRYRFVVQFLEQFLSEWSGIEISVSDFKEIKSHER